MSDTGLVSTVAFKLLGGPTFFGPEDIVEYTGAALDWLEVGLGMHKEEEIDEMGRG